MKKLNLILALTLLTFGAKAQNTDDLEIKSIEQLIDELEIERKIEQEIARAKGNECFKNTFLKSLEPIKAASILRECYTTYIKNSFPSLCEEERKILIQEIKGEAYAEEIRYYLEEINALKLEQALDITKESDDQIGNTTRLVREILSEFREKIETEIRENPEPGSKEFAQALLLNLIENNFSFDSINARLAENPENICTSIWPSSNKKTTRSITVLKTRESFAF